MITTKRAMILFIGLAYGSFIMALLSPSNSHLDQIGWASASYGLSIFSWDLGRQALTRRGRFLLYSYAAVIPLVVTVSTIVTLTF